MGVLEGSLGPHSNGPSGSRGFNDSVVRLSGSLAVQVVDLSNGVGSLQDFDLGFGGSLSSVLGPPHDLHGFDIVGDGECLDGSEGSLGDGSLHGVFGVGVPDVLLEGGELLGALERGDFGSKDGGEFVASSGADLECLLAWREGQHGLEGSLRAVFEVDVHAVEQTDGAFPEFNLGLERTSVRFHNVLKTLRLGRNVPRSNGASSFDALHGDVQRKEFHAGTGGRRFHLPRRGQSRRRRRHGRYRNKRRSGGESREGAQDAATELHGDCE
mmetsp:Transcript_29308/g.55018  ORF Transcript_29308/g.55018 Transcript_29308/m.55018 type:complete len:270 (-) Transcript_29308:66-875(-)